MKNQKKQAIVIEEICVSSLIKLGILSLKYKWDRIFYFKKSPLLSKLFKLRYFKSFHFFSIDELMTTPKDGHLPYCYHPIAQQEIVDQIMDNSFNQYSLLPYFAHGYSQDKLRLYIAQRISFEITHAFMLIEAAQEYHRIKNDFHYQLLIQHKPWIKDLRQYGQTSSIHIEHYRKFSDIIFPIGVLLKYILEIICNAIASVIYKHPTFSDEPKIGVAYLNSLDFKRRNDLFWFPNAHVDPKSIVVYFNNTTKFLDETSKKILEDLRIPSINLIPPTFRHFPFRFFLGKLNVVCFPSFVKGMLKQFLTTLKALGACRHIGNAWGWWQWRHLSRLFIKVKLYESLFTHLNIKVHCSLYGLGDDMNASNLACDTCGTIDIATHWSNYFILEHVHYPPQNTFFCWGEYHRQLYKASHKTQFSHYLQSGYPFDNFFTLNKNNADKLRLDLQQSGAKFIIGFFDENYEETVFCMYRKADLRNLYKKLLLAVIEDSTLGLLIKTKHTKTFQTNIADEEMNPLLKRAEQTGRMKIFDNRFPSEIAQASDIIVGISIANTAVLEGALMHIPFANLDFGTPMHPYSQFGENKIVFHTIEDLWQHIEQFRHNPKNYLKHWEEFQKLLHQIDHFQDGKSSRRIADYMKMAIHEYQSGLAKKQILERINNAYHNKYEQSHAARL